jgi:hypothetical protein
MSLVERGDITELVQTGQFHATLGRRLVHLLTPSVARSSSDLLKRMRGGL